MKSQQPILSQIHDPHDEAARDRALDEVENQIGRGLFITHDAMIAWLRSWGTTNELPPPKCGT
jgi:predicted transcriptional regulator